MEQRNGFGQVGAFCTMGELMDISDFLSLGIYGYMLFRTFG